MGEIKDILERYAKLIPSAGYVAITSDSFDDLETELDRYLTTCIDNAIDGLRSSGEAGIF